LSNKSDGLFRLIFQFGFDRIEFAAHFSDFIKQIAIEAFILERTFVEVLDPRVFCTAFLGVRPSRLFDGQYPTVAVINYCPFRNRKL
jgi:hypothetical protein